MKHLRKRTVPYVLFLLFLSSCCPACPRWDYDEALSSCPELSTARTTHSSSSASGGLELELVGGANDLRMYLNTFSLKIPPSPQDPDRAMIRVRIDEEEQEVLAYRFQGGQRLLIPEETRDKIIEALLSCKSVVISTGRYNETITSEDFRDPYSRLLKFNRNR